MKIAEKVKEFFHNEGIHSTTIQPEFVEIADVSMINTFTLYNFNVVLLPNLNRQNQPLVFMDLRFKHNYYKSLRYKHNSYKQFEIQTYSKQFEIQTQITTIADNVHCEELNLYLLKYKKLGDKCLAVTKIKLPVVKVDFGLENKTGRI